MFHIKRKQIPRWPGESRAEVIAYTYYKRKINVWIYYIYTVRERGREQRRKMSTR